MGCLSVFNSGKLLLAPPTTGAVKQGADHGRPYKTDVRLLQSEDHGFDLGIGFKTLNAAFSTVTGLIDPTKWHGRIQQSVGVDPNQAGLNRFRNPVGAFGPKGPGSGRELSHRCQATA